MSKYLAVEFQGTPESIANFLKQKGFLTNLKIVSPNEIYIETTEDNIEEVMFFKNFVLDDLRGEKIINVNEFLT